MGLSSNILWHQTSKNSFYDILKTKKLRYSYSLERIVPIFRLEPIAFPMISVSDYPFSEISNNKWTYGDYCIGFRQNWGVKVGFSPVWYTSTGSRGLRLLSLVLEDTINTDSKSFFGASMFLFSHMKFTQAPLKTKKREYNNYRFYDEREWRVVPYITETDQASIMPFLTEEGYNEFKKNNNGSSLLDIGVDFQYEDIHYIIVKTEADIQRTKQIVGDRIHIFTKKEVVEDIIGIDHHDEILPSIEQMDYEAAQRYADRLIQKAKEVWKNRNMNSEE